VDAELQVGSSGQFEVFVDGRSVIKKSLLGFPSEQEVVDAVAKALGR
jgi:selenoprotein W-related protein